MPKQHPVTISIKAVISSDLLELFLQHVRDFDVIHDGCDFSIVASTNLSVAEMEAALARVQPPFKHRAAFRKH